MKFTAIRPSQKLLQYLSIALLLSMLMLFLQDQQWLAWLAMIILLAIFLVDYVLLVREIDLQVEREISHTLPLGVPSKVSLHIQNLSVRGIKGEVVDHYPTEHKIQNLPGLIDLASDQELTLDYKIIPQVRGEFSFEKIV